MLLLKSHPVLAALDVIELCNFYEQKLGFQSSWKDKNYGIVHRDEITLHFWHCDNKIFPENTSCYVDVMDVDTLYEEMKTTGVVHPNGKIADQPWGRREFAILDLHGNLIRFGEHLANDQ